MSKKELEVTFDRDLLRHYVNGEEIACDDPRNPIEARVRRLKAEGWSVTFHGWRGDRVCYKFAREERHGEE